MIETPASPSTAHTPLDVNPYQRETLFALNRLHKHIYAGTVPLATIARRRAHNKAARRARRTHRKAQA